MFGRKMQMGKKKQKNEKVVLNYLFSTLQQFARSPHSRAHIEKSAFLGENLLQGLDK
jgi:hypothetical protein